MPLQISRGRTGNVKEIQRCYAKYTRMLDEGIRAEHLQAYPSGSMDTATDLKFKVRAGHVSVCRNVRNESGTNVAKEDDEECFRCVCGRKHARRPHPWRMYLIQGGERGTLAQTNRK